MYRDHRKGPGGPPDGATYPGGPHGLKWEGNQPLVGWGATLGLPPHAPRVGNPRGEFPLAWGARQPLPPWPPPPLGDPISKGCAPPLGGLYKGGREGSNLQPWAPPSSPATPLSLADAWRSPAEIPLHPPPRRRAAGSPSTSPSPLLDQEGGDVAAPYMC